MTEDIEMEIKDGSKTTELRMAIGGIVSVIVMFMIMIGAISQTQADEMSAFLLYAIPLLLTSAPIVIGWIVTVYTNARRDVKTAASAKTS